MVFWKIFIRVLARKKEYKRAIKIRNKVYVIDIHEFIPVQEELSSWKDAFEDPKA